MSLLIIHFIELIDTFFLLRFGLWYILILHNGGEWQCTIFLSMPFLFKDYLSIVDMRDGLLILQSLRLYSFLISAEVQMRPTSSVRTRKIDNLGKNNSDAIRKEQFSPKLFCK